MWHRGSTKGIFNPEENDCHSGLAQTLAESSASETEKESQRQKGVSMRCWAATLGQDGAAPGEQRGQGLSDV